MHKFKLHTAEVLQAMQTKIKSVCPNIDVFVGNRPTSSKKQRNEMLVISIPYGIVDNGAVQNSYYRIEIIVKNDNEGLPKIGRLDEISKAIVDCFPFTSDNGLFTCYTPRLVLSGHDGMGYYIWNLQASMKIWAQNSYLNPSTT